MFRRDTEQPVGAYMEKVEKNTLKFTQVMSFC